MSIGPGDCSGLGKGRRPRVPFRRREKSSERSGYLAGTGRASSRTPSRATRGSACCSTSSRAAPASSRGSPPAVDPRVRRSSDSGSLVVDAIAANGDAKSPPLQRVLWAFTEGAAATALLKGGGGDPNRSLRSLQAVSIVGGLPFTILLCMMAHGLRGRGVESATAPRRVVPGRGRGGRVRSGYGYSARPTGRRDRERRKKQVYRVPGGGGRAGRGPAGLPPQAPPDVARVLARAAGRVAPLRRLSVRARL